MKKVAFICTHNSCRSQIAEAFGHHLASDVFESFSAGTSPAESVNPDAERLMRERFGIDMEAEGQRPKTLSEIPPVDAAVTMGCGVQCPFLPAGLREDWGLEDPEGKPDEAFLKTAEEIRVKVLQLRKRLSS